MTAVQPQIGERVFPGFVDKRRANGLTSTVRSTSVLATPSDYASLDAMNTYLLAHGYTQAQLNILNINDIVWAYRSSADAAGI